MSFSDLLVILDILEDDYYLALKSCLNAPKVFLKSEVSEIRLNPYMKLLLSAWKANRDLQYILDPYACATYIVSYISKSQRGMSVLLDQACKEAKEGDKSLKQQVRHIGNKFLNAAEISAQEAAYLVLQLPLTRATREVFFIPTSPPEERTFLLKSKSDLEKIPLTSTDIQQENIIQRYARRPRQLQNWCLADFVSEIEIIDMDEKSDNI